MLFFAVLLSLTGAAGAGVSARGPHGGEMKPAFDSASRPWIELVLKNKGDSKEIHAYGVEDGNAMNLQQSGYGGVLLKIGKMELPLDFYKVDENGHVNNDPERREHYRAIAKFPESSEVELEVTIAFPSKRGTGKALFRPFQ